MVNESRNDLNDYLYGLFYNSVSKNVYPKDVPTELTPSDTHDGFIVLRASSINDIGEFRKETSATVRCYVEVYVPVISRGRYNRVLYKQYEDAVNSVIDAEIANPSNGTYTILDEGLLSYDDDEHSDGDNRYMLFIKSFLVLIDEEATKNNNNN